MIVFKTIGFKLLFHVVSFIVLY